MSFEPDALEQIVRTYLETVVAGDAQDVAALYAEDATVEDPVGGGEVHIGQRAIAGFYEQVAKLGALSAELRTFRAGGHEAAFLFSLTINDSMRVEPIEIMTFTDGGLIASMKAYWSPHDVVQI